MNPFDLSWNVAKADFYFDRRRGEHGVHYPPERMEMTDEEQPSPAKQESGRKKQIGPNTRLTTGGHYAGANIANLRADPSDEELERLGQVLGHEVGHAAIHDEILGAGVNYPSQRYNNAAEFGAHHLQLPGGPMEDFEARRQYAQHPNTKPPQDTRRAAAEGALDEMMEAKEGGYSQAEARNLMTDRQREAAEEWDQGTALDRTQSAGLMDDDGRWKLKMLQKMPVYHGTSEEGWEKIQQEGLHPTDHAPQLFDHGWFDIQEKLGLDADEMSRIMGGDWSFYYGDQAENTPWSLGGKEGAMINANEWRLGHDNEEKPVVLEINDKHPDSPFFMPEPKIDGYGFNERKDQRRTNKVVPPHLIRRVSQEELDDAHKRDSDYSRYHDRTAYLMEELIRGMIQNKYGGSDEDFHDVLDMKNRLWNWIRNAENIGGAEPYWGPVRKMPYHGTTTDRVESILSEGLKPEKPQAWSPEAHVFYTKEPKVAAEWAEIRSELRDGAGDPVVFHFPEEAVVDPEEAGRGRYMRTAGAIAPEHLTLMPPGPSRWARPTHHDPHRHYSDAGYNQWLKENKEWREELQRLHDDPDTAFGKAWDVLKTPLDLDSVKIRDRGQDGPHEYVVAQADFIHPQTGRRFPMTVEPSGFAYPEDMHGGHTVQIDDPEEYYWDDGPLASAETRPVELDALPQEDTPSMVNQYLSEYGGVPVDQWTEERMIESDESILPLLEEMRASQTLDRESAMKFLENRQHTGDKLRVNPAYRRLGMGTALYDLLDAVGIGVTPDINQDILGRAMWLKNQGITDHKFSDIPIIDDQNAFKHKTKDKTRGDLEYDYARLGSVNPPRWRGLKERMEAGE